MAHRSSPLQSAGPGRAGAAVRAADAPLRDGVTLKQRHKEDSIKLRYGSLYTVIELLLRRGMIAARETAREGRRPERTVYEMTPPGSTNCAIGCAICSRMPAKEYPQFEAALCLLPVLPPDEALALLRQRQKFSNRKIVVLARQIAGKSARRIFRRCFSSRPNTAWRS